MAARMIVECKGIRYYGKPVIDLSPEELQEKIYGTLENLNKLTLELDGNNIHAPGGIKRYLLVGPEQLKDCLFFVVGIDE